MKGQANGQTNLEVSIIKGLLFLARNWLAAQGYASVVSAAKLYYFVIGFLESHACS